jgi:hypothetical protein
MPAYVAAGRRSVATSLGHGFQQNDVESLPREEETRPAL